MAIQLYNLFKTGMLDAFGTLGVVFTFLSGLNFFYWAGMIKLKFIPAMILSISPFIFGAMVGAADLAWGLGVIIMLESLYLVTAMINIFSR